MSNVVIDKNGGVGFTNGYRPQHAEVASENATLESKYSGKVIPVGADALVFDLPSDPKIGDTFVLRNIGANDAQGYAVSPPVTVSIFGTIGAVTLSGVAGKDILYTKSGSKKGDSLVLEYLEDGWYASGTGVYASEA